MLCVYFLSNMKKVIVQKWKIYIFNTAFHSVFWPEHAVLHLPGMSLLVVTIKCCHVALEVLLQLIEGAHCLIKCPGKATTTHQQCNHWNLG